MAKTVRLFLIACVASAGFAAATAPAQAYDIAAALLECRAVAKDKKRLKCFDAVAAGLEGAAPSASRSAEAGQSRPEVVETPALSPEESFGKEDLPKTKEQRQKEKKEKLRTLIATAIEIAKNRRGKYVVILDNGQVWRQLDADSASLLLPPDDEEIRVKITRRMFGAHMLNIVGDNRSIRVERIK